MTPWITKIGRHGLSRHGRRGDDLDRQSAPAGAGGPQDCKKMVPTIAMTGAPAWIRAE